jgi:hypothetical protein
LKVLIKMRKPRVVISKWYKLPAEKWKFNCFLKICIMKSLDQIKLMNKSNFEKEQMNKFFGGTGTNPCTADTTTVNSDGTVKNDGPDPYEGECGVAVNVSHSAV